MQRKRIWSLVLVGTLATALAGCPGPSTAGSDGGPSSGPVDGQDGGQLPGSDGGSNDPGDGGTPTGPTVTTLDPRGAFLPSPTWAILLGSRIALFGTKNTVMDPAAFGRPSSPDPDNWEGWMRSGLIALDTETGAAKVYDSTNGLPLAHLYDDVTDYGSATAPIFGMTWIDPDHTFAMAGWDFVIRGTLADDGSISFRSGRVKAAGQTDWAHVAHIVYAGGELFVATDQGVAVVDPETLLTQRWIDFGTELANPWINALTVGRIDGEETVGMLIGPPMQATSSRVALVKPGESTATLFAFSDGSKPLSIFGMNGRVLVGATTSDGRGAIYALEPSPGGRALDVMLPPEVLVNDHGSPLLPALLSWDATRSVLVVGGKIQMSSLDGGLMQFHGAEDGTLWGTPEPVLPESDPYSAQLPTEPGVIAFDAQGRMYITGLQYCGEYHRRRRPVYRLERDRPDDPRLVRPFLSGIRDIKVDPEGNTWLATRDTNPGLACEGVAVDEAVCRLRADGACEIVPIQVNTKTDGIDGIDPTPGVYELAFGSAEKKQLALATRADATWLRTGDTARVILTQYDPSVSLRMTSVAFGPDDALWIGSEMWWDSYPGLDEELVNRRSPHGLGLLEFDERGRPTFTRRYIRAKSDQPRAEEIEGMPSDTVWAVQPLPGTRRALVALGQDRFPPDQYYEHNLGDLAPVNTPGGVVLVEDSSVTVLSPPESQTFSEVHALAEAGGRYYAVDDELGVLELELDAKKANVWTPRPWTDGERALSLAVDDSGRVAVGTTQGLYVFGANKVLTRVFDQQTYGYVWRLRFLADGALYAGTDDGLVRVALDGATLPAELGPASFADRTIWPLPPSCGGTDGCACTVDADCASGYACQCTKGSGCACTASAP